MRQQDDGASLSPAGQTRVQITASGRRLEDVRHDAVLGELACQQGSRRRLVAGRIGRLDPHDFGEQARRLFPDQMPIGLEQRRRTALSIARYGQVHANSGGYSHRL